MFSLKDVAPAVTDFMWPNTRSNRWAGRRGGMSAIDGMPPNGSSHHSSLLGMSDGPVPVS